MSNCKNCKNCANAIFDEVWGEYKCSVRQTRIRDVNKRVNCEDHEEKKKEKKNA